MALVALSALVGGRFGAFSLFVALAVLVASGLGFAVVRLLFFLAPDMPAARIAEEGEPIGDVENPVLRQAMGQWWAPDPFEAVKRRIDAEEPGPEERAPAPVKLPAQCPLCKKDLEAESDGAEIGFCYHCGAALG